MVRESYEQIRHMIAQSAARMIAEDGINDFAYAKKKAGRQLGVTDKSVLPSNVEIESEIRLYHEIYNAEEQPLALIDLRKAALATMLLFERFNPYLSGCVLDGTAGKNSQTDIHLFADSAKEVEIFLLSEHVPFETSEKTHRLSVRVSKDKKEKMRKTVPIYTLETEFGLQKLSVFEFDDLRRATKRSSSGSHVSRIDIADLKIMIPQLT